jgi:hypothetical protein
MAAYADYRVAMLERKGPVVCGRNDNLSMSIGESVLLIDDRANESFRELLSPIVGRRNGLYDNTPFSIDNYFLGCVFCVRFRAQSAKLSP